MNTAHRALVLTGGGARGAYQAGVVKYIAENIPNAHFDTLVGSSSGAINVAGIASCGGDIQKAGHVISQKWSKLQMDQVFRTDVLSLSKIGLAWIHDLFLGGFMGRPLAQSLVDTSPLRSFLQDLYRPDAVKEAIESGKLRNVAISATEVFSGSLVTFVQSQNLKAWQRARRRSVQTELNVDHVMASSAIPLLFPSSTIDGRRYVDGCIRSTTPLSPATRLGAEKILAIGVRRYYGAEASKFSLNVAPDKAEPSPSLAQIGSLVLNSLFAESLDADVEHLERLNNLVAPSPGAEKIGMRKLDIMVIRPSEDLGAMAVNYQKMVPPIVRFLLRGIGSERGSSSDILSYLLFVPEFLTALIDLGYADAHAEGRKLREFFAGD